MAKSNRRRVMIFVSTMLPGMLVLLAAQTSHAGGGGLADCSSINPCQISEPSGFDPAFQFVMTSAGIIHVEYDFFTGPDCVTLFDTPSGDLSLGAGLATIEYFFDPPMPTGAQVSEKIRVDACPETPCVNYTLGSDPPICQGF